jgi:rhamnulokinase
LSLWRDIVNGLRIGAEKFAEQVVSVGVDTWGVDCVLFDKANMMLGPGYCYRDRRNEAMVDEAFRRMPKEQIFAESGIQFMQINTLYQLLAYRIHQSNILDCTDSFLMVPDFYHWLLSGQKVNEATNASTTQMIKPSEQAWSQAIIDSMQFDRSWFRDTTQPGTNLGKLTSAVAKQTNLRDIDVICPASHDTASAVIAIPVAEFKSSAPKWGYISSGTWSLMGVELDRPIINDQSLALNFTNEAGPNGSVRLLKNIAGLWPLQQVREEWKRAGQAKPWDQMIAEATQIGPLKRTINLDDPSLINPSSMQEAVFGLIKKANLPLPSSQAEMTRLLLESLALRYQVCLGWLEQLLGYELECLYIVGGGVNNELLCQLTADATNRKVIAAHSEATAIGNGLMQAIGVGHFNSINEARDWLKTAISPKEYWPRSG